MMGLPAIITLSITAWDYFFPKQAVLRVAIDQSPNPHSHFVEIALVSFFAYPITA